jgi:uncharacterized protein (DUF1800 family)
MNRINQLYWRAGFGLSPDEWRQKQNWTVQKAVDELFNQAKNASPLPVPTLELDRDDKKTNREMFEQMRKDERQRVMNANTAWVERMADPKESALVERMTFFWHGHFACRSEQGKLGIQQLNILRQHGLGHFRDLVMGITQDPSMIRYLNNQQNRKEKPNENFARELMELFTLGRGNYTEMDVKEGARAFTGWSSTLAGDFVFRPLWHDYGVKTFFGKSGTFNGEDIIEHILSKPEAAYFITKKIYRHFVNDKVNEDKVKELAQQFFKSDYHIGKLMRSIFESEWFYAPENQGAKIKSPIELIAGMMRSLDFRLEQPLAHIFIQKALGQMLFNPPNVAGWPGGKTWIDNSTLTTRLSLPSFFFNSNEFTMRVKDEFEVVQAEGKMARKLAVKMNLTPLVNTIKSTTPEQIGQELAQYFLPIRPSIDLKNLMPILPNGDKPAQVAALAMRIMSLPEYQLC